MSDNGERATVRRQRREARVQRRDELAALGKLMQDVTGRRYLYNLLSGCHVYTTSFATNALNMAFREGERNVGLRIAADMMEAAPDLYFAMLKEGTNERSSTDAPDDTESGDDSSS